jgi:hypothetical protein
MAKHEFVKGELQGALEKAGSVVQREPQDQWPSDLEGQQKGPRRADLKVTGGACPGLSAAYVDVSVASPYHESQILPLTPTLDRRCADKEVAYHSVFTNFYPFVLSTSCSYQSKCSVLFDALKSKGVDVVHLKRSIAMGMLKLRASAYTIMYDGLRQRRSGVDHFFTPSQQTSTRATLAYASARFGRAPVTGPAIEPDWAMDTG